MAENIDRFVSISEATAVSGVSRRTIGRWLEDEPGSIRTDVGPRGARLVWLADVVAKDRNASAAEVDDDDAESDDAKAIDIAQRRVFGEMAKALALQNQHVERMHEPTTRLIEMLSKENEKLRARIDELEKKNGEMLATHEKHLSDEYARQREEQRERRTAARAEQAFQTLARFTPALLAGVMGHFGQRGGQEAILVDAVNQLTDEQFRAMIASGLFGPDVIALIERIRATATGKPHATQTPNNGSHTQEPRAA